MILTYCETLDLLFCLLCRTLPMATTMYEAMMTATSAAVDSPSMCPTLGQSTLLRNCPLPAQCTVSMALSLESTSSPRDTLLIQWADPRTNSSKLASNSLPNQPAYILLIPSTAAQRIYLLRMVVPLPAMSSLLPMRRWMLMTNQIRPARCLARLAFLMPPHKYPHSSPTWAGPPNACRLTCDWTKDGEVKKQTREKIIIATLTYLCGWTNMNG